MKVLVINCGSSSLKYQLLDMNTKTPIAKGLVERIGLPGAVLTHRPAAGEKEIITAEIPNHTVAIQLVLDALVNPEYGVLKGLEEIGAVGHRVVHGGEKFASSVLIDDEVMQAIEECIELAPLHNPPNIAGIEACQKLMPGVPQVAVFDTAFHQTMPAHAYLYGLPYELYEKYKIRKYGFHGTSHKYVSQRAAELLGRPVEGLKLISCHLGNGSSITAIKDGKSLETSMGFTPLEGLMMGTRSGDLDPSIVSFIQQKENLTSDEVNDFLNKKSGVLGLSGVSSDFRDIEQARDQGNYRAGLALQVFAHDVKKYIGSYAAVLDGADAIIFTAGLGENSAEMRETVVQGLDYLGTKLDLEKNKTRGQEIDISVPEATCRVLVIPTNEELMIALDTLDIVSKG
ncbi:acetate kinase [Desulfitobacterium dichloroeliminans LMG P-21439]|uniref:Acetate kinase n=1 Tax=Desulfitobacterium dichloroeliminans (strain LMG P-21439 / DCA1) TaxID=871963 RepID=L0FB16_DESDL|nr:acetate kinase [Desulfitobacterium dichloroeliminans]AGA70128.1 acetate kinase [Desulfitobacterium dichloroeliminans LMG P-21439]